MSVGPVGPVGLSRAECLLDLLDLLGLLDFRGLGCWTFRGLRVCCTCGFDFKSLLDLLDLLDIRGFGTCGFGSWLDLRGVGLHRGALEVSWASCQHKRT